LRIAIPLVFSEMLQNVALCCTRRLRQIVKERHRPLRPTNPYYYQIMGRGVKHNPRNFDRNALHPHATECDQCDLDSDRRPAAYSRRRL